MNCFMLKFFKKKLGSFEPYKQLASVLLSLNGNTISGFNQPEVVLDNRASSNRALQSLTHPLSMNSETKKSQHKVKI